MPALARRRFRRRLSSGLIGLLLASLLLPATAALALGADPEQAGRGEIVDTFQAAPTFSTSAVPNGVVGIKSSVGYEYDDGSTAIVGEILNRRSLRTINVLVTVTYLDSGDGSLGTKSSYVFLDRTARGGVAPFVVFNQDGPPGTASYLIDASAGSSTTAVAAGALDVNDPVSVLEGEFRYYEGTISNPNAFAVSTVTAMLTVYDDQGEVIEVFDQALGAIAAGASVAYSIGVDSSLDPDTAGATIMADGYRTGQASAYVTSWANYFDDLPLETFRRDIVWLAEQRITTGCAAGRYCPTANVTRAQMAQFLDRAMDLPDTTTDYFTDDDGKSGEASINRLAASGITGGCTPTRYCPTNSVTRGQMAAFLDRALDLANTTTDYFTDDETSTFEASINRLAAAQITGGCGGTKYCPTATVTRGQMAAFLRRGFEE
jgi:hypothetical protein